MTKIVFYKTGDTFWGFEEQGHTGYGTAGDDVLCAAISSMTMLIINSIELADLVMICEEKFGITIEDDDIRKFTTVGDVVSYLETLN